MAANARCNRAIVPCHLKYGSPREDTGLFGKTHLFTFLRQSLRGTCPFGRLRGSSFPVSLIEIQSRPLPARTLHVSKEVPVYDEK